MAWSVFHATARLSASPPQPLPNQPADQLVFEIAWHGMENSTVLVSPKSNTGNPSAVPAWLISYEG